MTVLFASTATAASGTGLVRQNKEAAAYAGRWLPAADGPGGELARSSTTTRPATPTQTLVCSRRCWHGTWTAGQAAGVLWADGAASAACCARRTQRGPKRPTALECTNFACLVRRCGGPPTAAAAGPDPRVRVDPVPLCTLRQCGACPLPLRLRAGYPHPPISRDTRSRDPPGSTAALLVARGARAIRRTMPLTRARSIRAQ
jgi:hypothetical protein